MTQHTTYGEVPGPPTGEMSRRSFMRRMLGVGVGILSLEFLGATLAFLWPNLTEGLGAEISQDHPGFVLLTLGAGSSSLALYERTAAAREAGVPAEGSGFRLPTPSCSR